MSQENVEIVRRGFDYVQTTGQLDPETMHPDFVWDTTTFRGGMRRRACVGVDEANAWIAEWDEAFENWTLDLEAIHDVGDRVIAVVRQRAKALHGGPEVEMRFAQIWTFRDGRATRMELYADPDEALEAAGLSE